MGTVYGDCIGYLVKHGSPLQRGAELAQFIAERAGLIKLPESQGGYNFSDVAKNYLIGQNKMANFFNLMTTTLEPYLQQTFGKA